MTRPENRSWQLRVRYLDLKAALLAMNDIRRSFERYRNSDDEMRKAYIAQRESYIQELYDTIEYVYSICQEQDHLDDEDVISLDFTIPHLRAIGSAAYVALGHYDGYTDEANESLGMWLDQVTFAFQDKNNPPEMLH